MKLLKKYGFSFLISQKLNGCYVNLPFNVTEGQQSELTDKVRDWLRNESCPYVTKGEDEAEDLLGDISGELEEGYLDMPIDSSYIFFLELNKNVILHVDAADEYLGQGDYTIYASISGLIVTPLVTEDEVREAVEWIKKFK
ncbi:hypothetical protein [Virgibacillus halodenitrificans]|uniref:hypothetical protein n=1 Tax=Virgibacillus halodenitrificans TaxID=1482 RepID=UPI000EF52916|nr:hypothetical protein [Virgibacillus halodenitrificans]